MTTDILFTLALSLLLTHEMDAVRRREWQVLPLLARIDDDARGYAIFTALHVPLYALLLGGLMAGGAAANQQLVRALDAFCVVHVALHLLFARHPRYQFNNRLSWTLIAGAGICGAADLLARQ